MKLTVSVKQDYTVILQVTSKQGLHQLQEHLRDYGLDLVYLAPDQLHPGQPVDHRWLAWLPLFVDEKIVLITETEIFQKKVKRKIRRQTISNAERLKTTMSW